MRLDIEVKSDFEGFISPTGEVFPCSTLGHAEYAASIIARILGLDEGDDVYEIIGIDDYADHILVRDYRWIEAHACGRSDGIVYVSMPNVISESQKEAMARVIPNMELKEVENPLGKETKCHTSRKC